MSSFNEKLKEKNNFYENQVDQIGALWGPETHFMNWNRLYKDTL